MDIREKIEQINGEEFIPGTTGTKFLVVSKGKDGVVGVRPLGGSMWRVRVVPREATEEEVAEAMNGGVVFSPDRENWGGTATPLKELALKAAYGWKTPEDGEKRYSRVVRDETLLIAIENANLAVGAELVEWSETPEQLQKRYTAVTPITGDWNYPLSEEDDAEDDEY